MNRGSVEEKERVDRFINSKRNEETKQYAKEIITFLSKIDPVKEQGWVRVKEMKAALVESGDIPFNTTFFRLLEELTEAKIIERKEAEREPGARGKRPIYYRVPFYYPETWFLSRDELLNELNKVTREIDIERNGKIILLRLLREILKQCPEVEISELIQQQKKYYSPFLNENTGQNGLSGALFDDPILQHTFKKDEVKIKETKREDFISAFKEIEEYFIPPSLP